MSSLEAKAAAGSGQTPHMQPQGQGLQPASEHLSRAEPGAAVSHPKRAATAATRSRKLPNTISVVEWQHTHTHWDEALAASIYFPQEKLPSVQ